jgi:3',5'-cyclic AMP phosphodiesterase CpdA
MPYVIAQLSDTHIGGPNAGSGERFSMALSEINQMSSRPDLVLLTGDVTHNGTIEEWTELGGLRWYTASKARDERGTSSIPDSLRLWATKVFRFR